MIIPCGDTIKSQVKEDIKKFLYWTYNGDPNIDFESAKKIIKTPEDACYLMSERNYDYSYISNYNISKGNTDWVWGIPAKLVYKNNGGGCVATANLFNALLSDKYDDSGYVSTVTNNGGHAINWFKINGLYYYFDFSNINPIYYNGVDLYYDVHKQLHKNPMYYLWFVTKNPKTFFKFYSQNCYFLNFTDEKHDEFVYIAYQCRAIQKELYPTGIFKDHNTKNAWGSPLPQIFSDETKDDFILFTNHFNYPIFFEETPKYREYQDIEISKTEKSISLGKTE